MSVWTKLVLMNNSPHKYSAFLMLCSWHDGMFWNAITGAGFNICVNGCSLGRDYHNLCDSTKYLFMFHTFPFKATLSSLKAIPVSPIQFKSILSIVFITLIKHLLPIMSVSGARNYADPFLQCLGP